MELFIVRHVKKKRLERRVIPPIESKALYAKEVSFPRI